MSCNTYGPVYSSSATRRTRASYPNRTHRCSCKLHSLIFLGSSRSRSSAQIGSLDSLAEVLIGFTPRSASDWAWWAERRRSGWSARSALRCRAVAAGTCDSCCGSQHDGTCPMTCLATWVRVGNFCSASSVWCREPPYLGDLGSLHWHWWKLFPVPCYEPRTGSIWSRSCVSAPILVHSLFHQKGGTYHLLVTNFGGPSSSRYSAWSCHPECRRKDSPDLARLPSKSVQKLLCAWGWERPGLSWLLNALWWMGRASRSSVLSCRVLWPLLTGVRGRTPPLGMKWLCSVDTTYCRAAWAVELHMSFSRSYRTRALSLQTPPTARGRFGVLLVLESFNSM